MTSLGLQVVAVSAASPLKLPAMNSGSQNHPLHRQQIYSGSKGISCLTRFPHFPIVHSLWIRVLQPQLIKRSVQAIQRLDQRSCRFSQYAHPSDSLKANKIIVKLKTLQVESEV